MGGRPGSKQRAGSGNSQCTSMKSMRGMTAWGCFGPQLARVCLLTPPTHSIAQFPFALSCRHLKLILCDHSIPRF